MFGSARTDLATGGRGGGERGSKLLNRKFQNIPSFTILNFVSVSLLELVVYSKNSLTAFIEETSCPSIGRIFGKHHGKIDLLLPDQSRVRS